MRASAIWHSSMFRRSGISASLKALTYGNLYPTCTKDTDECHARTGLSGLLTTPIDSERLSRISQRSPWSLTCNHRAAV
jgi:hypothetical protein